MKKKENPFLKKMKEKGVGMPMDKSKGKSGAASKSPMKGKSPGKKKC